MRLDIRLNLDSEHARSQLLTGLDSWAQLGLLQDWQIRQIAKALSEPVTFAEPSLEPTIVRDFLDPDIEAAESSLSQTIANPKEQKPNRIGLALRALLDEISVIWLLLLGVFLVIVSSGLLAASQWQSFSSVGQYAVLLAYTLAFWGASVWTGQRENLRATARMLSLTTLLLIPINFWVMDALGVLRSPVGIGAGALSALLLSCLPMKLLDRRSNQVNLMALSWLHWGWLLGGSTIWPVVATYVGTVGTAANLASQDRRSEDEAEADDNVDADAEGAAGAQDGSTRSPLLSFDTLAIALAVCILLFRSLFIAQVPPEQLGLAAGICGWLLVWITRHQQAQRFGAGIGAGLLGFGWLLCIMQRPPLQAIAVSLLALWLVWDRLKATWRQEALLLLLAIAAQIYWLGAEVIPDSTRDTLLTRLAAQLSPETIGSYAWMSLGFFPFVLGLLLFARQLRRRWQQPELSVTTEYVALAAGVTLSVMSASNSFTAAMNLLLSTTVLILLLRRREASIESVTLTHTAGLLTVAAWIDYLAPSLSANAWAYVVLGGAIAELFIHLRLRHEHWRLSTWHAGLLLSALSYGWLLANWDGTPVYSWLIVPVALTYVASRQQAILPRETATFAMVALLMQAVWMVSWPMAIATFAISTLCMALNSRILRDKASALFTVGAGIALVTSSLWYVAVMRMSHSAGRMMLVWALMIWALWLLKRRLDRRSGELRELYQFAVQSWSLVLMGGLLLWGSLVAGLVLLHPVYGVAPDSLTAELIGAQQAGLRYVLAAMVLLLAALLESIRYRPAEWRYWSLAWATEIVVVMGLALRGLEADGIAVATLALGLVAQISADVWVLSKPPYRQSWHGIPMVFAVLGLFFGHSYFGPNAGLFTIFAGAIAIGVGRRQPSLNSLSYIGLFALSAGAYELLIYRMMQPSGGAAGDGFTLLAVLALAIALIEKFLSFWLLRYLQIPPKGLRAAANAHWLLSGSLIILAATAGLSEPTGILLWTTTTVLIAAYALINGNRHWTPQLFFLTYTSWTEIGIISLLLCAIHNRLVWFPDRMFLVTWGGIAACVVSFALQLAPWQRWGWPLRPWRLLALWLPLSSVLGVAIIYRVPTQSLLIVGAFYAWMAKMCDRPRLSYLSVLLFDWALLRYLDERGWLVALTMSLVASLSVLYVVEIDPYLQGLSKRQERHWLRTLASELVSLTALYQAEVHSLMLMYAAITVALCIGLIFAGLALKIRAFLYVGTGTFVLQVVRVLWLFVSANSLLLWAVGIVLGLLFIWVAATFESRRSQVTSRLDAWTSALETWD